MQRNAVLTLVTSKNMQRKMTAKTGKKPKNLPETPKMRVGKIDTIAENKNFIQHCLRKQAREGNDMHYTRLINNATKLIKVLQIEAVERRLDSHEQRHETHDQRFAMQDARLEKILQMNGKANQ